MVSVYVWLLAYALELLLFVPSVWKLRQFLVLPITIAGGISTLLVILVNPALTPVLLPVFAFRLVNTIRIHKARINERYLYFSALRTATALAIVHVAAFTLVSLSLQFSRAHLLYALLGVLITLSTTALLTVIRSVFRLNFRMPSHFLADRDLPTVTVAIPARNETRDLEACLRSIIASDYPKLEILVLDDCSQAKTADIIRSFAQDGVRFIKGEEPHKRWLAKNQAYETLFRESSGKLLLFCGVDARLGTGTIRGMVNLLHARKKQMLSVLPLRVSGELRHSVIQPMRYWWELAIPRRLFNRPAVLSTCWMVERATLKRLGGFKAVSHSILPEAYLARQLVKNDGYSFVRSTEVIDVRTEKSMLEQRNTALRVRYPQLRRRPENVLLLTMFELFLFVGPLVGIVNFVVAEQYGLALLSWVALAQLIVTHIIILQITNPANVGMALITSPVALATEIVMSCVSMLQYEFGTVEWKDRNVCIPVMHVYPRLPALPKS